MSYKAQCYRDRRIGQTVISLDRTDLDSHMPFAVSKHLLLEGGGSCLKRVDLFFEYESALAAYRSIASEPILKTGEGFYLENVYVQERELDLMVDERIACDERGYPHCEACYGSISKWEEATGLVWSEFVAPKL